MSEPLNTARRVSRRRILKSLKSKSQHLERTFDNGSVEFDESDFSTTMRDKLKSKRNTLRHQISRDSIVFVDSEGSVSELWFEFGWINSINWLFKFLFFCLNLSRSPDQVPRRAPDRNNEGITCQVLDRFKTDPNFSFPHITIPYSSVVGQPATGLLVKVLKMRHQGELSGGHWTFVRKM